MLQGLTHGRLQLLRLLDANPFDPRRLRFLVELHHGEKIALIGQRNRRHAPGSDSGHQFRYAHDPIDQGVFGVQS